MPRLYCEEHGKEYESRCQEEQENYRWLGETIRIVTGRLKAGAFHCDYCKAPLKRRQKAWLMTAFPRPMTADVRDCDFAQEGRYFNMKRAEVRVYGAAPSGGLASPATVLEAG